jgi:hypothetical protein
MCQITPTIEETFWKRQQDGPDGGRQERMEIILSHLRTAGCADCNAEMQRVFDDYKADQAMGDRFPITYSYLGLTLLWMGFLFGLIGKVGVAVGNIPPFLAMLGIGCLVLHVFVRRRA